MGSMRPFQETSTFQETHVYLSKHIKTYQKTVMWFAFLYAIPTIPDWASWSPGPHMAGSNIKRDPLRAIFPMG